MHTSGDTCWRLSRKVMRKIILIRQCRGSFTAISCSSTNELIRKNVSHINKIGNRRLKDQKPVVEGFLAWVNQATPGDNAKLKKAITYIKNRRDFLMTYLEDGRCSLSKNLSENAIRPSNCRSGELALFRHTLVRTCRMMI